MLRPRYAKKLSGDDLQQAIDLRARGWTYKAIGDHFGLSHTGARLSVIVAKSGSFRGGSTIHNPNERLPS